MKITTSPGQGLRLAMTLSMMQLKCRQGILRTDFA